MTKRALQPDGVLTPKAPFSPVVVSGDHVYTAGQVAFDESGDVVSGGIEEQTRRALDERAGMPRGGGLRARRRGEGQRVPRRPRRLRGLQRGLPRAIHCPVPCPDDGAGGSSAGASRRDRGGRANSGLSSARAGAAAAHARGVQQRRLGRSPRMARRTLFALLAVAGLALVAAPIGARRSRGRARARRPLRPRRPARRAGRGVRPGGAVRPARRRPAARRRADRRPARAMAGHRPREDRAERGGPAEPLRVPPRLPRGCARIRAATTSAGRAASPRGASRRSTRTSARKPASPGSSHSSTGSSTPSTTSTTRTRATGR